MSVSLILTILLTSLIFGSLSLLILMLNTVHSLLLLIEIFLFGAILLFFFQVEFFGLIFLMIYLGAILVLFLFVVMKTSSIQNDEISGLFLKGFFLWCFIPLIIWWFLSDSILISEIWQLISNTNYWTNSLYIMNFFSSTLISFENLHVVGWYLFDFQPLLFIFSGVILYIAMIGAIVITVDTNTTKSNQKIQNAIVQGMRKGALVSYYHANPSKKQWKYIPKWHWGKSWFVKPAKESWQWLGSVTK